MGSRVEECYKFVRDRHDKLIAARAAGQTRVGQLIVFVGFVIAAVLSAGLPQLFLTATESRTIFRSFAFYLDVVALAVALICLGILLFHLVRCVEVFTIQLPLAPKSEILHIMADEQIGESEIYTAFTMLYLDAIEMNELEAAKLGNRLRKGFWWLKMSLVATACFVLGLTLLRLS